MAINILIVDDSEVMRKMIKKTINLCGLDIAQVYEAGNGKEGLQLLKEQGIDLLFIDINMPVMNGMEMLGKVRSQPQTENIAILIISTESNEGRIKTIGQQNAEFVHKPFTPEILRSKILEVIDKKAGEKNDLSN